LSAGSKNGIRRVFYEDQGARISILAAATSRTPDTLTQTNQLSSSKEPLANGAGHTFLFDRSDIADLS
jgi:hypothetical protein